MKLYYSAGACSLAPHIVAKEAGLAIALERVDLRAHKTADGSDFYGINPKGSVPFLLLDSGEYLSEGPIICQYLADLEENNTLIPAAGTMARYRVMEWQNYITSELHKSFSPLFNPASAVETKAEFAAGLKKKYAWVSAQLADKNYLTGDDFTVADAYLFVVTNWTKYVGLDISEYTPLTQFLQRVASRPAVLAALKEEGLIS